MEIAAIHNFSYKICRQANKQLAEKIQNLQLRNLKLYKASSIVVIVSALIYVYHPMESFIMKRELVPLLPIDIIFIDQSTTSGFVIANVFMVLMGLYAVVGTIYMILHLFAAIFNYEIQVEIIEGDIRQLDAFWRDLKTSTRAERHLILRNICQKCQDKDK